MDLVQSWPMIETKICYFNKVCQLISHTELSYIAAISTYILTVMCFSLYYFDCSSVNCFSLKDDNLKTFFTKIIIIRVDLIFELATLFNDKQIISNITVA